MIEIEALSLLSYRMRQISRIARLLMRIYIRWTGKWLWSPRWDSATPHFCHRRFTISEICFLTISYNLAQILSGSKALFSDDLIDWWPHGNRGVRPHSETSSIYWVQKADNISIPQNFLDAPFAPPSSRSILYPRAISSNKALNSYSTHQYFVYSPRHHGVLG